MKNITTTNNQEMIDQLYQILSDLKKYGEPSYDGLYCYIKCLETADCLIKSEPGTPEEKEEYKKLDEKGWKLRDFFMTTRISQVRQWQENMGTKLVNDDRFIELFCDMKIALHMDLMTLLENELEKERDMYMQKDKKFQRMKQKVEQREKDGLDYLEDEYIEYREREEVLRFEAYQDILLKKYFTNKTGKKDIKIFANEIRAFDSFFIALDESRNKLLKKLSWKDTFRLQLLMERWVAFYQGDLGDSPEKFLDNLEYRAEQSNLDVIESRYEEDKEPLFILNIYEVLDKLMERYDDQYDRLFEYLIICRCLVSFSKHKAILSKELKHIGLKETENIRETLDHIWKVFVQQEPAVDDDFYAYYGKRFTLKERRTRTYALDMMERGDARRGLKEIKKLKRHQDFFRMHFNIYMGKIGILIEDAQELILQDGEDKIKEEKILELMNQAEKILHELCTYVVNKYPRRQKLSGLEKTVPIEATIIGTKKIISGENFNKKEFISKRLGEIKKVKQKKVKRNDPCPCGSGKKYKKCCW